MKTNKMKINDMMNIEKQSVKSMLTSKLKYIAIIMMLGLAMPTYAQNTDGDGRPNSTDIDDDNDGILDIVEDSCLLGIDKRRTKISSQMGWIDQEATFGNMGEALSLFIDPIDDIRQGQPFGNTLNPYPANQAIAGLNVMGFEFIEPAILTRIQFEAFAGIPIFNAGATVRVQASNDGITWTNISGVLNTNLSGAVHNFNTTNTTVPYERYRILGVSGTMTGNRLYETNFNETLQTICDADGDGIPNSQDLDSDEDGCSDTVESGGGLLANANSVVNFLSGTDSNNNGLLNRFERQASGELNYVATYDNALDNSFNACTDSNGDGISDIEDLDDDNDGVSDLDEMEVCTPPFDGGLAFEHWDDFTESEGEGGCGLNPSYRLPGFSYYPFPVEDQFGLPTNAGPPLESGIVSAARFVVFTSNVGGNAQRDALGTNLGREEASRVQGLINPTGVPPNTPITYRLRSRGPGPSNVGAETYAWVMSADANPANAMEATLSNGVSIFDSIWTFGQADGGSCEGNNSGTIPVNGVQPPVTQSPIRLQDYTVSTRTPSNPDTGHYISFWLVDPFGVYTVPLFDYSLDGGSTWVQFNSRFSSFVPGTNGSDCGPIDIDTDGDGIPNRLDLDSDGDMCSDSFEADIISSFLQTGTANDGMPPVLTTFPQGMALPPYGNNGLSNGIEDNDTQAGLVRNNAYNGGSNLYFDRAKDATITPAGCPLSTPQIPRIRLTKSYTGGTGVSFPFPFSISGASANSDSITTTGGLQNGAQNITGTTGTAITITEGGVTNFPASGTTVTCRDAGMGNAIVAMQTGRAVTVPGTAVLGTSDITCAFVNTFVVPQVDATLSKTFSPASIQEGGTSTTTITVTNPAGNPALTGVSFTDSLSGGLVVAPTPNATVTGCGPGTVTASGSTISLNNASLTAGASTCVVTVDVTTSPVPTIAACPNPNNTNATANFTATSNNLDAAGVNACLTVTVALLPNLDTVKSVLSIGSNTSPNANTLVKSGEIIVYRITTSNTGTAVGTEVLTETVPAGTTYTGTGEGWTCAPNNNANSTCTRAPLSVPINGNATANFTVTAASPIPLQPVITNTVAATNGACTACTVNTTVSPRLTKIFNPDVINDGGVSTATITLTKASGAAATGIAFTDILPTGLIVSGTPTASQCGGTVSVVGNNQIVLTGGSMASGVTSCTIVFDVTTN